jgi:hypothetical protein
MIRNIFIINNELCQYHFTGKNDDTFELSFSSEQEITFPTNSPEMTVIKALAYSKAKSKDRLSKVAVEEVVEQLLADSHIIMYPIETIKEAIRTKDFVVLLISSIKQGDRQDKEHIYLSQQNGKWVITEWRLVS